ncbi:hypothetical protein A3C09_04380 [Candidatus Uhrbacteria bacterium RIFCSPHIGHO2_02_FULL_47_44]|uniref:N-acetyltransferase domain-containing protein n=1 Tax=Candidatus Uhrbacteria bacterium RIFCSPLOWO2_02_FULL_48_18 TaxID=1802408 RepID=A0A1F7V8A3_9BACT|nr:MAG: hypothetical protein A2839_02725 [Candidatus Uhrbacteria bacterium RIFCSPHIGHO2_01_FULL_47_10]OGL70775.1 MAG: hypothetical protein A3C09_04380 [Candidatus Uhrbacteria bacterium RIFCSPHIGHO2_02_FULL_47_44]OGL75948.1 MAG: hypothetical protein A3E97_04740 [Candidatus Uhrbacteria bacterium RIFCSPHIGHO2_12_FULL_47_12]OGL82239.1 MAG: hypothetical protein A3B20_00605 [Candidatus Uhrbacteria bacterium RIFCSPLOWO2_01_FULL_47_17]OGL86729.1 MAG: hypothetical protein A3I41_05370 [Candidatus Uhrbact
MSNNKRPSIKDIPDRCWDELSQNLLPEKAILHTRTTPDQLKRVYEDGYAVIELRDEQIVGFFAAWPVAEGFHEVGTAWVRPDLRGHGIGHDLYLAMKALLEVQDRLIFGVTTNPISVHLGHLMNLTSHTNWRDPIPWELTCGRCDKYPDHEKHACPIRDTECRLRVMKPVS